MPINAHTHRAPYLLNGKAYELQTWYTDGGRPPASATGAMTSEVKGQGRKVTWSSVSLEASGGIPCRPNLAATLLVPIAVQNFTSHCSVHLNNANVRRTEIVRAPKDMLIYHYIHTDLFFVFVFFWYCYATVYVVSILYCNCICCIISTVDGRIAI